MVAQTAPSQPPRSYATVLGGLQASTALIEHDGNQEGVAIELTPLGSRTLFGMPARGAVGPVSGAQRGRRRRRCGAVGATPAPGAWETASRRATTSCFASRVTPVRARAAALLEGPGRLGRAKLSVNQLASEMGYSRQHLRRRFNDEFGLSPKLAARIVRFERARRMLPAKGLDVAMADVAAACGYYDQSHLHRDFADLAGCTPREWLGEDFQISKTM